MRKPNRKLVSRQALSGAVNVRQDAVLSPSHARFGANWNSVLPVQQISGLPKKTWLIGLLALTLFLAACNSGSASGADECLVGAWRLTSKEAFARASIPEGAFEPETLNFLDSKGGVVYGFGKDGKLIAQMGGWVGRFDVDSEYGMFILDLIISGGAVGNYSLEGDTLTVEALKGGTISYVAELDGERMMETYQAGEFLPLFVAPFNSAQVECTQETLSLKIIDLPAESGPLVFERIVAEE